MRDDELSRVPKSIPGWQVAEFLESLGITYTDVFEVTLGIRSVEVKLYATNAIGRKFLKEDKEPAMHTVTIELEQVWERPKENTP